MAKREALCRLRPYPRRRRLEIKHLASTPNSLLLSNQALELNEEVVRMSTRAKRKQLTRIPPSKTNKPSSNSSWPRTKISPNTLSWSRILHSKTTSNRVQLTCRALLGKRRMGPPTSTTSSARTQEVTPKTTKWLWISYSCSIWTWWTNKHKISSCCITSFSWDRWVTLDLLTETTKTFFCNNSFSQPSNNSIWTNRKTRNRSISSQAKTSNRLYRVFMSIRTLGTTIRPIKLLGSTVRRAKEQRMLRLSLWAETQLTLMQLGGKAMDRVRTTFWTVSRMRWLRTLIVDQVKGSRLVWRIRTPHLLSRRPTWTTRSLGLAPQVSETLAESQLRTSYQHEPASP